MDWKYFLGDDQIEKLGSCGTVDLELTSKQQAALMGMYVNLKTKVVFSWNYVEICKYKPGYKSHDLL